MKRWIAWLLLACTLLLAACKTTPDDTSSLSAESSDVSSENSDTGNGELKQTLVSVGKKYTSSSAPESRYADLYNQQLTDGEKAAASGAHYTDHRLVGYTQTTRYDIDLEDDGQRISALSVRALDIDTDGVKLAGMVRFYGSNTEGANWESLGKANFVSGGDQTMATATLVFDEVVNYRYIRASVALRDGAHFFFIDEIEVYADVEKEETAHVGETVYLSSEVDTGEWKSLSTGVTAAPVDRYNVAYGVGYTFENCTFDERAPQNDTILTDESRIGRIFLSTYDGTSTPVHVGFKAEGTPSISMDLGKSYDRLYCVQLSMLGSGLNVSFPGAIDIYGSADGKEYILLGRVYAPSDVQTHIYTLLLPEYIEARYLKFDFIGGEGYIWIEEIMAYTGYDEIVSDELYPELNFPIVTEDAYWDSSESDYKTKQNLLLGLTQQIVASEYVPAYDPTDDRVQSPWNATMLTDGQLAPDMYCYSSGWFFSKGGGALDFFYDLGKLSTVEELSVSLLEQQPWGIYRPKYITMFLSDDGETWYKVYAYERAADTEYYSEATRVTFSCELDTPYAARFVRFRIESAVLFIDEFEAIGTKEVKSSTARLADSDCRISIFYTNPERAQYANSENTGVKAEEIALLWGGNEGDEDMLKGFVAYLDEDGNIADTMMDGIMYFPDTHLPTGVAGYQASGMADWEYMYDTIFNGSNGLDKLEKVVGEVKDALRLDDYKVQVYFPILRISDSTDVSEDPKGNVANFGDVDGDGVVESTVNSADRIKIVNWYIDLVKTEFAARGYENIELDGFCWVNEDVDYEYDDSHIITEVGDCMKAAGTNLLWIPYYTANRYYLGYEMGVDVTNMQPNYMFDLETPEYHLHVAAKRTKSLKMCIEIEHNFEAFGDPLYLRNYMLYLYYGVEYGYVDAIHIYYDNIENISMMAYSDDPMCRFQYDATYQFIKGTLEVYPEARETLSFSAAKDTVLSATLNTENTYSLYTLASAPSHGSVSVGSDGSVMYYPEKGYTGTDSFTYTYNNYLGESEICTVEITVS